MPFLTVDGIKLHFYDAGETADENLPALLFLHGSPGQISNWKHILPCFERNYRVVAVDLRGYGKSDKPLRVTLEDYIKDIDAIRSELGLENVVLIGHSFGAMIAIEYAARRHVNRIVLIGPVAYLKTDAIDKIIMYLPPAIWKPILFKSNPLTRRMYKKMFFSPATPDEVFLEFMKDNKDYIESLPPQSFRYLIYMAGYSAKPSAERVKVPTLIIVGEDDVVTPPEHAKLIHEWVENSKLVIIPKAGHLILYEKPEEICRLIKDFIKGAEHGGEGK